MDMPFVPILVVEEDLPLNLSRFWAERKKEEEPEEEKKRLEKKRLEKKRLEEEEMERRMKEKNCRDLLKVLEALEQIAEALPRDPSATSSGMNVSPAAEHGGHHGGDPARSDHGAEKEWIDEHGRRWLRYRDVPGRWYLLGSEVCWDEPGRRA